MDKEVGTGYVRTMSLLFDTRTDTHTQSHSHIQMLWHTWTSKYSHKNTHTHVYKHKHKHMTPDVDKGGCTRRACTPPLSFKSQLLYYLHWPPAVTIIGVRKSDLRLTFCVVTIVNISLLPSVRHVNIEEAIVPHTKHCCLNLILLLYYCKYVIDKSKSTPNPSALPHVIRITGSLLKITSTPPFAYFWRLSDCYHQMYHDRTQWQCQLY